MRIIEIYYITKEEHTDARARAHTHSCDAVAKSSFRNMYRFAYSSSIKYATQCTSPSTPPHRAISVFLVWAHIHAATLLGIIDTASATFDKRRPLLGDLFTPRIDSRNDISSLPPHVASARRATAGKPVSNLFGKRRKIDSYEGGADGADKLNSELTGIKQRELLPRSWPTSRNQDPSETQLELTARCAWLLL